VNIVFVRYVIGRCFEMLLMFFLICALVARMMENEGWYGMVCRCTRNFAIAFYTFAVLLLGMVGMLVDWLLNRER
jgi:hypothetical protein